MEKAGVTNEDYPRTPSVAFDRPEETALGQLFAEDCAVLYPWNTNHVKEAIDELAQIVA